MILSKKNGGVIAPIVDNYYAIIYTA